MLCIVRLNKCSFEPFICLDLVLKNASSYPCCRFHVPSDLEVFFVLFCFVSSPFGVGVCLFLLYA